MAVFTQSQSKIVELHTLRLIVQTCQLECKGVAKELTYKEGFTHSSSTVHYHQFSL